MFVHQSVSYLSIFPFPFYSRYPFHSLETAEPIITLREKNFTFIYTGVTTISSPHWAQAKAWHFSQHPEKKTSLWAAALGKMLELLPSIQPRGAAARSCALQRCSVGPWSTSHLQQRKETALVGHILLARDTAVRMSHLVNGSIITLRIID